MIRFRPRPSDAGSSKSPDVRALIGEVLAPGHFFAASTIGLAWEPARPEETSWEIYQGRLLDPAHTTQRRTFEAWNLFQVEDGARSAEPLLSVKLDTEANLLHVVRAMYCYAWEGYDAGGNVFLSRETCKWVRELIGTIDLGQFADEQELRDELVCLLFRAVVGTSRLPLTSVEAPLPAFSLGRLAYFCQAGQHGAPARSYRELVERLLTGELCWLEKAKLLETLLHAVPAEEMAEAVRLFWERWQSLGHDARDAAALVRTLFNEVSLSPWTDLVPRTLTFLQLLEDEGSLQAADAADLVGHLLRQLGRHLTAYDLVTFHHQGANYPDALLLDALLQSLLDRVERRPALFLDAPEEPEPERRRKRLRRRALRQAWLLRRRYEDHPVPDAPTSQGESLRVLPLPHPRVPEEQILQPGKRTKRLFEGDPLADHLQDRGRAVLEQAVRDLEHPAELRELGVALFLDRPLGAARGPLEPDRTLLLSCEAFSCTLAERRLQQLVELTAIDPLRQRLRDGLEVSGIPVSEIATAARPGTVSLADARRTADDFLLLRTTSNTVADFLSQYDFKPLAERLAMDWLSPDRRVLIVGAFEEKERPQIVLRLYDAGLRPRLELTANLEGGYGSRAGIDYPANGLLARCKHDVKVEGLVVRPAVAAGRA